METTRSRLYCRDGFHPPAQTPIVEDHPDATFDFVFRIAWIARSGRLCVAGFARIQPDSRRCVARIIHDPFVVTAFMRSPAVSATSDPMNRVTTSLYEQFSYKGVPLPAEAFFKHQERAHENDLRRHVDLGCVDHAQRAADLRRVALADLCVYTVHCSDWDAPLACSRNLPLSGARYHWHFASAWVTVGLLVTEFFGRAADV
jgi:hypothetical protein